MSGPHCRAGLGDNMVLRKKTGGFATLFIASLALLSALGFCWPLAAQEGEAPAPPPPAPAAESEEEPVPAAEPVVENQAPYAYNVAGRRDPFKSLLERNTNAATQRPEGLPGVQITEVDVLGVVGRSDGSFVAIVKGAGNESYTIRAGDRLFDGEVLEILADRVLFRQRINDPTLARNFREVRILLNPDEEGNR
jgi:Tfp pilus assembly protein PilP